jgi:hypothetical protein
VEVVARNRYALFRITRIFTGPFVWTNPHAMMTLEVQTSDVRTEKLMVGGPVKIVRLESQVES